MEESKHLFYKINKDSNYRDLEPGEYIDAENLIMPHQGADRSGKRESIMGNTALSVTLPAGTNRCVGAAWDKNNKDIVFINQNSNGNHGLYRIILSNNSVALILSLSNLDNDLEEVEGLDFLGDYIFWTDGNNRPYYLNRSFTFGTDTYRSLWLALQKNAPNQRISAARSSVTSNTPPAMLISRPLQFAYRFRFKDNTRSVLSPFSNTLPPLNYPEKEDTFNRVTLSFTVPAHMTLPISDYLESKIEIYFREGENGVWRFIDSINPASSIYVWDGLKVGPTLSDVESSSLIYDTPLTSNSLIVAKNILLLSYNTQGYDDFGSGELTLTQTQDTAKTPYFPKGLHKIGIVYFDKFMRPSFVKSVRSIEINDTVHTAVESGDSGTTAIGDRTTKVDWSLSGSPPSWAAYYQMFMTPDLKIQDYVMTPAITYFYIKNGETADPGSETLIDDRVYKDVKPGLGTNQDYSHLDFLIPANLSSAVDTDCYIRVVGFNNISVQSVYFKVVAVNNNFIRINRLESKVNPGAGLTDFVWSLISTFTTIEIVRFKKTEETIYYAASDVYQVSSGAFGTTSGSLAGRAHYVVTDEDEESAFYFQDADQANLQGNGFEAPRKVESGIISQTNSFTEKSVPSEYLDHFTENVFKYQLDRTLISNDFGRPNVENNDEEKDNRESTIIYSSPFIQNSNQNFLNQLLPANKKALALNRGPIKKIVATDEDVALVIHERTCTSLYIQEGFIRFADGAGPLTKTDEVIGQERKAQSNYGTIHPESVALLYNKVEGEAGTSSKVFWWDQNEGVVCRHSNNGIIPISDYGMKQYFSEKAKEMASESGIRVVGGCHPYWDAYLITFPAYASSEAETWVFSEEINGWIGRLKATSIPERYASSGVDLFSFVNGVPYIHNSNAYANFYGQQQECSITFVANTLESFEKVWAYVKMISSTNQVRIDFSNDRGQETHTLPGEYRLRDNKYYSDIRRDVNTNSDTLEAWQVARLHGDRMISDMATVKLSFTGGAKWALNEVTIGFKARRSNG